MQPESSAPAFEGRATEIAAIKNALHELLNLIGQIDDKPRPPMKAMWLHEIMEDIDKNGLPSPTDEILSEPIRGAATMAIKMLGKRLYKITNSTDEMAVIAEEVAYLDDGNYSHRINILDKRWDGIGNWVA